MARDLLADYLFPTRKISLFAVAPVPAASRD